MNLTCPACRNTRRFRAHALAYFSTDGDFAAPAGTGWEPTSRVTCTRCGHSGTASHFGYTTAPLPTTAPSPDYALAAPVAVDPTNPACGEFPTGATLATRTDLDRWIDRVDAALAVCPDPGESRAAGIVRDMGVAVWVAIMTSTVGLLLILLTMDPATEKAQDAFRAVWFYPYFGVLPVIACLAVLSGWVDRHDKPRKAQQERHESLSRLRASYLWQRATC